MLSHAFDIGATFNSAYINPHVKFDFQNAFLDEPAEDELISMLGHVNLMRDPRACKNMVPDEVWASLPPDPEVEAMEQEKEQLKRGQYRIKGTENEGRIKSLTRLIRNKKALRVTQIEQAYREEHFVHRHTRDLEAPSEGKWKAGERGDGIDDNYDDDSDEAACGEPEIVLDIPERARLAVLLCKQSDKMDDAELLLLRIEVGELMVALTKKMRDRQARLYQAERIRAASKRSLHPRPERGPIPHWHALETMSRLHWRREPAICRQDLHLLSHRQTE